MTRAIEPDPPPRARGISLNCRDPTEAIGCILDDGQNAKTETLAYSNNALVRKETQYEVLVESTDTGCRWGDRAGRTGRRTNPGSGSESADGGRNLQGRQHQHPQGAYRERFPGCHG